MGTFWQQTVAFFMSIFQTLLWFVPSVWVSDVAAPPYEAATISTAAASQADALAAGGGWYVVLDDEFDGSTLDTSVWAYSKHGLRNVEYWCDDMVSVQGGNCVIKATKETNHVCTSGICPEDGLFTGGIETNGKLEQAYGYFEARVKFPDSAGMWSAMWLQSNTMGTLGNGGKDGSEIDVYESAFYYNPTKIGTCVHWDGYSDLWHREVGEITDTDIDLYDDYHTWGLLWTPDSYSIFLDGKLIRRTNAGGVSQVAEYLRLTCEIRTSGYAPYGQKLGADEFVGGDFLIDYVRIYQHTDFDGLEKTAADFDQPLLAEIAQNLG
jgi:beta-glucanase (GH16 family)